MITATLAFLTAAAPALSATAPARKTNRVRAAPGNVAADLADAANRTDAALECLTDCSAEHTKKRHCSTRARDFTKWSLNHLM